MAGCARYGLIITLRARRRPWRRNPGGVLDRTVRLGHLSDDIVTVLVGELTLQIRRYPSRRRTRAYASNLLLNTKHALFRGELRAGLPDQPMLVLIDPLDAVKHFDTAQNDLDDVDVVDLLRWAGANGIAPWRTY